MYRNSFDSIIEKDRGSLVIARLIALWGFNEAALGGILHALRIPFTGLFIGGSAVIIISLLAYYSRKKQVILQSVIIVVIIKAIISPYTPLTAYFAVLLQGVLGYLFFSFIHSLKTASLLLAVVTSVISGFQKIVLTTIIFGYTIWESIDLFADFVINQFITQNHIDISLSAILISLYLLLHLTGGVFFGLLSGKIPGWIEEFKGIDAEEFYKRINEANNWAPKPKRRKLWQKISTWFIIILSGSLIVLSYTYEGIDDTVASKIIIMLVRVFLLIILWYLLISPYLMKIFRRFIKEKEKSYAGIVNSSVELFPLIKNAIKFGWAKASSSNGKTRIKIFVTTVITIVLSPDVLFKSNRHG